MHAILGGTGNGFKDFAVNSKKGRQLNTFFKINLCLLIP
jgi:hypothetical protein